jgi:hypothetical protein
MEIMKSHFAHLFKRPQRLMLGYQDGTAPPELGPWPEMVKVPSEVDAAATQQRAARARHN